MIRGEITLQAETQEELRVALQTLANVLNSVQHLDDPEGEDDYSCLTEAIIAAQFRVLPEYREGDLEKFIGCAPDFTGDLTTEEYMDKIRGGD